MHLADGRGRVERRDGVPQPPPGAAERLAEPRDRDHPLAHPRPGGERVVVPRVHDVLVDLVREHPRHVELLHEPRDQVQLGAREHLAGGVVRRVEHERLGPPRQRRAQPGLVDRPRPAVAVGRRDRRHQRDEHRHRPREHRVGPVVLVERREDHDLVARVHEREERRRHRLGGPARHGDLGVGVHVQVVPPPVLLGDRQPQRGRPPRDGVLVQVPVDRRARRVLHRRRHREVGEALREVDRPVLAGDARHLPDDAFGERAGAGADLADRHARQAASARPPSPAPSG